MHYILKLCIKPLLGCLYLIVKQNENLAANSFYVKLTSKINNKGSILFHFRLYIFMNNN